MILPYVLFVFLYVGRISSFRSLRAWVICVCSPYVISLCDFAYYVFVGMLYLSAISMMFVKIMLVVCMLVGMVV